MKVVILAGGLGSRLGEYTSVIPKPMVPVGGRPILWHLMKLYSHYGHREFLVALGYKGNVIKEYFLNYYAMNADLTVSLGDGRVVHHQPDPVDWQVTLVDTGLQSMTGGRVRRLKNYLRDGTFLMTYGDGLADLDINKIIEFHREHGKLVTVTAVHPGARFGELCLDAGSVRSFSEKPQVGQGWINGGFFVVEPEFLDYIPGDETLLEKEPLEHAAADGQLMAYRQEGFWQCMDTKRDHDLLEEMWEGGAAPWRR